MIRHWLRCASMLAFGAVSTAQAACDVPPPFDYVGGYRGTASWEGVDGTPCSLRARTGEYTGGASNAGFANAVFSAPRSKIRAQFHVDTSGLSSPLNLTMPVRIVRFVGTAAPSGQQATIAELALFGNAASTARILGTRIADSGSGTVAGTAGLTGNSADIRVEITIGTIGSVKIWIDSDFDQTPTIARTVDNLAWQGVSGIALGTFSATPAYLTANADRDIVFSDIVIDAEHIWSNGFEGTPP